MLQPTPAPETSSRPITLHLITGLLPGGAENSLLKNLPHLDPRIDHQICCFRDHGPVGELLTQKGIKVYYLDAKNILDISVHRRLYRLLKTLKPLVLVTYLPHADLAGRFIGRWARVPLIICSVRVKYTASFFYFPYFLLDGLTSFLVDHFHFVSSTIARQYRRYLFIPARKITVIPNGLDLSRFNTPGKTNFLRRLSIPPHHQVICCVARLRSQKGHHYLLSAFQRLLIKKPDTTLLLIGDGPLRASLTRSISKLGLTGSARLLGTRTDIPDLLRSCDVFVLPTLFEGLSNSLLEAMAAACPILTTNLPENSELIRHNINGLLVPPRNSFSLAENLQTLLDDPRLRTRLARQARLDVAQFDLRQVCRQFDHFYSTLLPRI